MQRSARRSIVLASSVGGCSLGVTYNLRVAWAGQGLPDEPEKAGYRDVQYFIGKTSDARTDAALRVGA